MVRRTGVFLALWFAPTATVRDLAPSATDDGIPVLSATHMWQGAPVPIWRRGRLSQVLPVVRSPT